MNQNIDIGRIRAETPGIDSNAIPTGLNTNANKVHLNASGASLMPQCVVDAVIEHTMLEAHIGGYEAHAKQSEQLDALYPLLASHIGAKTHEIAIMENATVAWCHAFYGLPLKRGSRILTCEAEYAANYIAFLQRAKRDDLIIDIIPSDDAGTLDCAALRAMLNDDKGEIGLIAITWVPTNGGLVNPAIKVGVLAEQHGVPYLLDACQAAGQMPIDVAAIKCDFLSATARKFMRGPRGIGFLYIADKWLNGPKSFEPAMIDLFGASWITMDQYRLRDDARRFENWENSYALRAGFASAIAYADAIGIDNICARVRHLADFTRQQLSEVPQLTLRDIGHEQCAIVSFTIDGQDPTDIKAKMAERGFSISTSAISSTRIDATRRGIDMHNRLAPHYYNTEDEIERFVSELGKIL